MSTVEVRTLEALTAAAESEWLERFTAGPTEPEGFGLASGTAAPDLVLADHTEANRSLSEFWTDQPVLLMFWRHFGCGCGFDRAKRLLEECPVYEAAGLRPVIVGLGKQQRGELPTRWRALAQSKERHQGPTLATPELVDVT